MGLERLCAYRVVCDHDDCRMEYPSPSLPIGTTVLANSGSFWTLCKVVNGVSFWASGLNTVSDVVLCKLHDSFEPSEPSDPLLPEITAKALTVNFFLEAIRQHCEDSMCCRACAERQIKEQTTADGRLWAHLPDEMIKTVRND